jgi:hypothetical protein
MRVLIPIAGFDGQKLSRGSPISVEWHAASEPMSDAAIHVNGFGPNGAHGSPSRFGYP